MKILFISRKFPPITGGMENYAYNLHKVFSSKHSVTNIILKKSQLHLIWFVPWVFLYGTFLVLFKRIDIVYIGDGVLSPAGVYFQNLLKKKVLITVYGLDLTFNKYYYQNYIKYFLPRLNKVIAISHATKSEALLRGTLPENCFVIPVGINPLEKSTFSKKQSKTTLEKNYGIGHHKKILFTIGRLVPRKGVFWFVENVIPKLSKDYIYLIAGHGKDYEKIKKTIEEKKLSKSVVLLGKVNQNLKDILFSAADIFISPNIPISNDIEGFGIVNLEASLNGLPVIASNIEGVKDAVKQGVTGFLVNEKDSAQFIKAIEDIKSLNISAISMLTEKEFSWDSIYKMYLKTINNEYKPSS